MTEEKERESMNAADNLWRTIVENETVNEENEVGTTKKKLERFDALHQTTTATQSKGRASMVKHKKTLEHTLRKERRDLLAHFLLGNDWTEEQRAEATLVWDKCYQRH